MRMREKNENFPASCTVRREIIDNSANKALTKGEQSFYWATPIGIGARGSQHPLQPRLGGLSRPRGVDFPTSLPADTIPISKR